MKLYSPHDFYDKEGFFRALSPAEQRNKMEDEVATVHEEGVSNSVDSTALTQLSSSEGGINTLRQNYFLAEDLAFCEIASEFRGEIRRNVGIGRAKLNGLIINDGEITAVEVKYTSARNWKNTIRNSITQLSHIVEKVRDFEKANFLLAFVLGGADDNTRSRIIAEIPTFLDRFSVDVVVRVYSFEEMKSEYGFIN